MKKVFVSGCYDLLHSGHVAFFKEASQFGALHVGIGSDSTIESLKGRKTMNSEDERLYMVKSIRYVDEAFVNRGTGILDFEEELKELKPDYFVVNEDGYSPAKEALCKTLGVELKVLERIPDEGLPARSTTSIRAADTCFIPYRIDLAGTWIDQPFVSSLHPGWAITLSLEPTIEFMERCGMSTSTRNAAKKIWPYQLPIEKPEKLAELLFHYENSPGSDIISGAQDAIGICMPGLVRHYYDKDYWPKQIESVREDAILSWLEDHISLVLLWPRKEGLDLLGNTNLSEENAASLAKASEDAWDCILNKDLDGFAKAYRASFDAQVRLFPNMVDDEILKVIESYKSKALAWKLAGAGGAGYLILLAKERIKGSIPIKVRRRSTM